MISTAHPDVKIVPNTGWDRRITAFRYKQLVTSFAVISQRYVVLIDTLVNEATAEVMVATMRPALAAGRRLLVINTHADWDHCWGNSLFAGSNPRRPAPIIGHRLCRERVLAGASSAYLSDQQAQDPEAYADVRLEPPTLTFDGSFTIHGGDLTFDLIQLPGHTADQIGVFVPEIQTLFVADAAEDPLPLISSGADVPLMRASFERMLALKPETVLYCHALGSTGVDVIHRNIAYFNEIEQRVAAALATRRVPDQIVALDETEAVIGFPFADAPRVDALENHEQRAFYHNAHQRALLSVLEHLRQRGV